MRPEDGEDVLRGHIEFHESLDLGLRLVVVARDCLRANETDFLSRIEMELDWGGGFECGVDQGTEDLHGIYGTGAVLTRQCEVSITAISWDLEMTYVVSTWGTSGLPGCQVDRVLVGAEDRDRAGGGTIDPSDHRELNPGVYELLDRDSRLSGLRGDIGKLIEDPLGGVSTGCRVVEAVVECGQVIQV